MFVELQQVRLVRQPQPEGETRYTYKREPWKKLVFNTDHIVNFGVHEDEAQGDYCWLSDISIVHEEGSSWQLVPGAYETLKSVLMPKDV